MLPLDLAKLILLAAIWGGSFIFLRIAVPEVGPLLTATLRVGVAALVLVGYAGALGVPLEWRRNLKPYALVGLTAAAVPFASFSYAAQYLPAAYSALLNSTAPLFGALLSIFWLAERLDPRKACGLLLGVAGVAILMGAGALAADAATLRAAAICMGAAASYAGSSIVVKLLGRSAGHRPIEPLALAAGSMAWGTLFLLPAVPFNLPAVGPSPLAWACVAALALLSTALAQALFIPLIMRIGPTPAMSVSFLIPLFAMVWGFVFLQEAVQPSMLAGAAMVLLAMALVLPGRLVPPSRR